MIPPKLFNRLLDSAVRDFAEKRSTRETDDLMDQVRWPWLVSQEQIDEWNQTHKRMDP